ncbi:MAG: Slp family lipoprotein [Bdellovibrio bacteriovorus]
MSNPRPKGRLVATALWAALLAGCATTDCTPPPGRAGLTPVQVADTGGHAGERLTWGGTLASARNLADRTELEVVGYPLNRCGEPRTGAQAQGRFILVRPGYLETADRPIGSRLSATGIITGVREGQVGGAPYRFPLLQAGELRWWPVEPQGQAYTRPWVTIGIGGGGGGVGGGIGVLF